MGTTPIEVAIPLPPLNLKNKDQLCPITRDNEDRRKDHIETSNRNNNAVGKNHLTNESKTKTNEPCTAPILLNTFDAPLLPVPISCIATFFCNLVQIKADGKEPTKYAINGISKNSAS